MALKYNRQVNGPDGPFFFFLATIALAVLVAVANLP